MLGVMAGWVTSPWHGIHNTIVAIAGVSAVLLPRADRGKICLPKARMGRADLVRAAAHDGRRAQRCRCDWRFSREFALLHGWSWTMALRCWCRLLYAHYGLASMTAHVTALCPGFMVAALRPARRRWSQPWHSRISPAWTPASRIMAPDQPRLLRPPVMCSKASGGASASSSPS